MSEVKEPKIDFGKLFKGLQDFMPETSEYDVGVIAGKAKVTVSIPKTDEDNFELCDIINKMIIHDFGVFSINTEGRKAVFVIVFIQN